MNDEEKIEAIVEELIAILETIEYVKNL